MDGARPFLDHLIHEAAEDPSIPGRLESVERIAQVLIKLKDPTARELYAASAATVLGMTPQQMTRALREAAAKASRVTSHAARSPEVSSASEEAPPVPAAPLPPEELHLVVLLARCPELLRTPEAARAGDLLLHPTLRQLHRAAAAAVAETGGLEVSSWLDAAPAEQRSKVAAALMDGSLAAVSDPPGLLRKLAARLELLRVEAEIAMGARLQREAHARGDDATLRALSVRGMELRKTKEGLQAALQRP
jgi:DNA-binding transcriptional ArsR family regulator